MIRTQIYLPEDLRLQLLTYSQIEGISVSEIIRKSIVKEFKRKNDINAGAMLLDFAKSAGRGPKDLSKNFFKYAYGSKSKYAK